MPLVAVDSGWATSEMSTSDVHLFTSILGELAAGRDMSGLGVRLDGEDVQYDSSSSLEQAAQLIWLQLLVRTQARPEVPYWTAMVEDLQQHRPAHIRSFSNQLEKLSSRLAGISYRAESLWEHVERVADNPQAVIITNPPTYKGAYEKFFDTKGRLEWAAPDYDVFDAGSDIPKLVRLMEGRKALLIVQQQQTTSNAAHTKPVYARQLAPGQLVYMNTNRPDEVAKLLGGLKVARRRLPPIADKPWPTLPQNYNITAKSTVELLVVDGKVADAYRGDWMHRLYPVLGSGNVMVLVDGYATGVIGYSAASMSMSFADKWNKHVILRFAFGAPHESLRLTRLATMFALQHSTLWLTATPLNAMFLEASKGLVTSEMTRHPEAKGLRGLMKLDNRQQHPDGYKLVYAADWAVPAAPSEVLADFLSKEAAWRKAKG